MIVFGVNDMSCGHCVDTITKAIESADSGAKVTIDLIRRLVMVESADADPNRLRNAIARAGYTPEPVDAAPSPASGSGSSCCDRRG